MYLITLYADLYLLDTLCGKFIFIIILSLIELMFCSRTLLFYHFRLSIVSPFCVVVDQYNFLTWWFTI